MGFRWRENQFVSSSLSLIGLFGAWFLVSDFFELVQPLLLPSLLSVFTRIALVNQWQGDLSETLVRWLTGFVAGGVAGGVFGLLIGWSERLRRSTSAVFELFRALPVTAIFPLLLLIVGIGDESKIVMAAYPTFFITAINTSQAMRGASPERRMMARSFGATPRQIFRYVALHDALPGYFTGLRVSLSLSLAVAVVAEMFIGTDRGLGQKIFDSYLMSDGVGLYAYLILIGVTGWVGAAVFGVIERRCLPWLGR